MFWRSCKYEMNSISKYTLIVAAISLIFFSVHSVNAQFRKQPPPEAIEACRTITENNICSLKTPRGIVKGICRNISSKKLACIPSDRPGPGSFQGNQKPNRSPFGYDEQAQNKNVVKLTNKLTDTGQKTCFDEARVIACPKSDSIYFGQDAQYQSRPSNYQDNNDNTISDLNTGLKWQKGHNAERLGYYDAKRVCSNLALGGRSDWRLPKIKELFSISDFSGSAGRRFFINADSFDFALPSKDILIGDRFASTHRVSMMGQTWSSSLYSGKHWGRSGVEAAFFFNFLDGRIKQAPTRGRSKLFYRCVSGAEWGKNRFVRNNDGTVTDRASELMWQFSDDGKTRDWPASLKYCEGLDLAGFKDWRLPNVKELQHIVDYSRNSPALDTTYLKQSNKKGWFWSSTTHGDNIKMAAYVCFGKCVSVDGVDVHGAGAQRSDPKVGNASSFSSLGGQRDQVRINNYARCVRDAE